jgi:hypothetical protein
LEDVFVKKGMTSGVMLKTKLLSLKHEPSVETLSEHFLKFDKIIRELEGTGSIMDESDKVCHLYLTMSAEYEMTPTELRTLPEKSRNLAMAKNKLLEEDSRRLTKRNVMRQEFETDTVTAFSSHRSGERSKWKRNEDGSPFRCNGQLRSLPADGRTGSNSHKRCSF